MWLIINLRKKKLGFFNVLMSNAWLVSKKESTNWLFVYGTSFLISFFSFLFISYVRCITSGPSKVYKLVKLHLIKEHHLSMFSSGIFILESFSMLLFNFLNLFIHIFVFSNCNSHFSPSIKSFQSSKRVWKHLISSLHFLYTTFFFSLIIYALLIQKY